jgi:hypothetical protein
MDIGELRGARKNLEISIVATVGGLVEKFREETGLSPYAIDIRMEELMQIGLEEKRFIVTEATVTIKI